MTELTLLILGAFTTLSGVNGVLHRVKIQTGFTLTVAGIVLITIAATM